MRTLLKITPLVLALLSASSCQRTPEPGPPNMIPTILGALQTPDASARDTALGAACREAADQGAGPAVLMGVPRIEDNQLRDEIAEECALTLGEAGQTDAAVDVAKQISNEVKRDELVARLKGE